MHTMSVDAARDAAPRKIPSSGCTDCTELKRAGLRTASDATGFYGAPERLLTYEPGRVWHIFAPETVPDLTVFRCPWLWVQATIFVLLAVAIMFIGKMDGEVLRALREFDAAIDAIYVKLQMLTAFLLGNFVALNVNTWKERRANYAALCGATRNLLVQLGSLFALHENDSGDQAAQATLDSTRRTLGRYALLAVELSMLKAR